MINNPYKVLNLSENASEEEVRRAYQELKKKYSEERFLEGEAGNKAAKNLTELETAYEQIISAHANSSTASNSTGGYSQIEDLIKRGDVDDAQRMLDNMETRSAEWHYYQSIIFYKKRWYNESKKQLEFACQSDPSNMKYRDALNKLNDVIIGQTQQSNSNTANSAQNQQQNYQQTAYQNDPAAHMGNCCCDLLICDACCPFIDLNPCC